MRKPGFIYVAVEDGRPGLCKVGQTEDPEEREKRLNAGKPDPTIKIVKHVPVDDMNTVERAFHEILYHQRHKQPGRREWFNIEVERIFPMMDCVAKHQTGSEETTSDKRWLAVSAEIAKNDVSGKKPAAVMFASTEERSVNDWWEFTVAVCDWLIDNGQLKRSFQRTRDKYHVNRRPRHPDGNQFESEKILSNGWHVETHMAAEEHVKRAARLLEHCGETRSVTFRLAP